MPRRSPAEAEATIASNIELFTARLTLKAWSWKNLDSWQRQVLKSEEKYMILGCSRQSGKSSTLACKIFHRMLTTPDALCLIVAEQRQSNEDIRKIKDLAKAYDRILRERYDNELTLTPVAENITSMELPNGARVIGLPGNEKVRGYSAPNMVFIDEAAFLEDEVFIGLDPMMEVGKGQLILASTPNGNQGFFYHEWNNPRYQRFRVPWNQCPRISPESIEAKRLTIGDAYVKQEYEVEFLDELTSLFDEQGLRASMDETEDVFDSTMKDIQRQISGEEALI